MPVQEFVSNWIDGNISSDVGLEQLEDLIAKMEIDAEKSSVSEDDIIAAFNASISEIVLAAVRDKLGI